MKHIKTRTDPKKKSKTNKLLFINHFDILNKFLLIKMKHKNLVR